MQKHLRVVAFSILVFLPLVGVAESSKPNILFCIADDASMKSFGAYGDTFIETPAIDKLAREGLVFENAFNGNPKCAPARASLVAGMYSWQLKEAANHWPLFPEEFAFYPHILMEKGYHVGFTGKGWGPGVYKTEHNPAGPAYNSIKTKPPYKGINKIDYAGNFAAFLDEKEDRQPFCFWLGVKEPHRAYEEDSWKKANRNLNDATVPGFYPDNETIRGDLLDYGLEVEWYDRHVGLAVELLEERGLLDNTLIIVTSDHGMPFPRVKGQIYEEAFRVPFIVYWNGVVTPGRILSDYISFADVAPTLMEAAGFEAHPQMTGSSFLSMLKAEDSGRFDASRDHVLLGKERHDTGRANEDGTDLGYPVRAIRTDEYLYVKNFKPERWPVGNPEYGWRNCDGSPTKDFITQLDPDSADYRYYSLNFGKRSGEELYRIKEDPDCLVNLADNPIYTCVKERLHDQMVAELTEQGDPRMLGQGDIFDKYPHEGKIFNYDTGKMEGFKHPSRP
ncbi:sulfatase [Puniceicoccales bacterium CK1056]|uniref:Sulfatase n=2 Tax=Oceanipulchritudo coccoides TaxID=2706888 RepID=A0A6B2LZ19_9BACT|nr:sulfatase [Oceanipulchritudo coccoides]